MGQSVDLDSIAYIMKDKSSLSLGDIQSVLTNYVGAMRAALFDGKSVNIRDFGVFSLSAHTSGATTKEDCTVKNIKSIQINFGPSSSVRPNLTSTRAGDKIEFLDLEAPKKKKGERIRRRQQTRRRWKRRWRRRRGSSGPNRIAAAGHEPYNRHEKDQSDRDSLFRHP